jgi:hypothetical protein
MAGEDLGVRFPLWITECVVPATYLEGRELLARVLVSRHSLRPA